MSDAALIREARCINHAICACDHRACFDGWLNEPDEPATRCPHCFDAALMYAEQNQTKRKWRP